MCVAGGKGGKGKETLLSSKRFPYDFTCFMTVASLLKMTSGMVLHVISLIVFFLQIFGGWFLLSSQYEPWAMGQSCFKPQLQFWLFSCEYGPKGSLITYQVRHLREVQKQEFLRNNLGSEVINS